MILQIIRGVLLLFQYSNHEELFTPPPNAVPEFPNFPGEEELADFAAAAIDEPEIEDEIER